MVEKLEPRAIVALSSLIRSVAMASRSVSQLGAVAKRFVYCTKVQLLVLPGNLCLYGYGVQFLQVFRVLFVSILHVRLPLTTAIAGRGQLLS